MTRIPRLLQRLLLAGALLVAAAWLALVLLLDPTAHKARIEEAASRVLGMEVSVDGPLALRWRPRAHLVLGHVRGRKAGADIFVAREAVLGVDLMSLLGGQPSVHSVALQDGLFAIVRERDGRFNFQRDPTPGPHPERIGPDISFTGATITYADPRFERRVEGRACRGEIDRVHLAGGEQRFLARLSFEGRAECAELRAGDLALTQVSTTAVARQGVIDLRPLSVRAFDAQGQGSLRMDFTGAAPAYQVEHTLRQLPAEQVLKALSLKETASGRIDAHVRLAMQGRTSKELQQALKGTVSLRGQGLVYHGADLDARFDRFESTQNFSLFDVGALFLAGPAGLLVTKGVDYAAAAQPAQGRSDIRALVSDWTIERGVARTQDVAMATQSHRVALKGAIDLVNDRFQGMTIALLDAKGCAKVQQQVSGALAKPQVDKPGPIEAIAAPAVRLLRKGAELVGADSCEAFYTGAVAAPAPSPK